MADHLTTVVYIEIKREAGSSGDAQQEGLPLDRLRHRGVHGVMADPQTRSTVDSKPATFHAIACSMKTSSFRITVMQSDLAMDSVSCTVSLLLSLQQLG